MKTTNAVAGIFIVSAIAFLFSACTKVDEIGTGILPQSDKVNLFFTDTATIIAGTLKEDSLRTSGLTALPVSYNIVGSYTDPVFGRSDASVYMQLNLSKLNFSFGAGSLPDSLILSLAVTSYYGDTASPMRFKVYRLDALINKDSVYYSTSSIPASTLIADTVVTVNPKDSTAEFGVKKAPHIRLRASMELAAELMSKSGGPEYADNAAFVNYFKGIYITAESVDPSKGCMYQFDYKSTQSKLALYYKVTSDSDSLAFNYTFDELLRFNHYAHYYDGSEAGNAVANGSSGSNYIYVQSMAGLKGKINLPHIKNFILFNPSVVVNNAVMIFKAESNAAYSPHTAMILAYADSAGKALDFSPDNADAANGTDGTYNASTGEYRFNVTRYINQVLNGKRKDYGVYLIGRASIINSYRTRIYGTANPSGKIKLELTYTKF